MQVKSAVIPAAGMGTRFLPATKAVPKELLPIGDTPVLQLVIDEALGAGVEHIVIVSNVAKPAIEAYFAPNPGLVETLRSSGRDDTADRLAAIGRDWRVSVVHQDAPLGLGHAVGCARDAVGAEPFAVLLPDEIMGSSSLLAQMARLCSTTGGSVVALKRVPLEQVSAYGVVAPAGEVNAAGEVPIASMVEKPPVDQAPSDLVIIGRYVLTDDVFDEIAALTPGAGGELQLTDALLAQAARSPLFGVISEVSRHDTGTPLGFLVAAIELALRDEDLGPGVRAALADLSGGGSDRGTR
jgi:UTP--glucose-1-phosphate uridylyltransferase